MALLREMYGVSAEKVFFCSSWTLWPFSQRHAMHRGFWGKTFCYKLYIYEYLCSFCCSLINSVVECDSFKTLNLNPSVVKMKKIVTPCQLWTCKCVILYAISDFMNTSCMDCCGMFGFLSIPLKVVHWEEFKYHYLPTVWQNPVLLAGFAGQSGEQALESRGTPSQPYVDRNFPMFKVDF